ncbi:MAG TPA: acetate--CoA ligase family protein [Bauldia sp.]|nr:acetate--CoA ligase family protein [Bauldia sp.]
MADDGIKSVFADVGRLLEPRSIVVIGASDTAGNLGLTALTYLRRFGFPGAVFAVNPGRESVAGERCYPSVSALPQIPDLAIVAVGESRVAAAVRESAAAGVRAGIVWAGGFAEAGAEGRARTAELAEICRASGFALLGPNCLGLVNAAMPVTATFASFLQETPQLLPGSISLVGQSGGVISSCVALAQRTGVGFRYLVSTGNEAVLTTSDFVYAFARDPQTKVIAAYVEGLRDGDRFVAALAAARAAGKPVVLLKGGASEASARAAAAHTGALAGAARVWDAVLREQAVIQVYSMEELLDVALFLNSIDLAKLPAAPGVAPITFGGGFGVLAADQCARLGLTTPPLSPQHAAALKPLVPPIASIGNPFDLTPMTYGQQEWMDRLPLALDVIASDDAIGAVFFQNGAMSRRADQLVEATAQFRERTGKTVCVAWPLAPAGVVDQMRARGFHVFEEYARAIRAIAAAASYRRARQRVAARPAPAHQRFDWRRATGDPVAGTVISEHECHRILASAGLPVARGHLALSLEDALAAARDVGFPMAVKGITPEATHRAKAGLLVLDVRSEAALRDAYALMMSRAAAAGFTLDGVYLQKMAPKGVEILVSALRDPTFGVMISVGAGGGMTELIDDVILASAPVDTDRAVELLRSLRLARGLGGASFAPMARFVADFSELAAAAPWRGFTLEVNPVMWTGDQVVAVDGLLLIDEP